MPEAEGAWAAFRRWLNRNQELKQQVERLQSELAEERSGRLAYEKLMSEVECRREDNMTKSKHPPPYAVFGLRDEEIRTMGAIPLYEIICPNGQDHTLRVDLPGTFLYAELVSEQ